MSELGPYERMTDQEKREFLRNRTCGPSQPETRCPHDRLNEEGICRACGEDRRGIGPDAPSAAQGTSAAEVAIIKLWAVAKHLNISDPPQPTDLLTAVALVEQAAEWARLHIERRGKENDELREQAVKLSAAQFVPAPLEAIDRERVEQMLTWLGINAPISYAYKRPIDVSRFFQAQLSAAYRRGHQKGQEEMRERAAKEADWMADVKGSNEEAGLRIAKAVRALPISEEA